MLDQKKREPVCSPALYTKHLPKSQFLLDAPPSQVVKLPVALLALPLTNHARLVWALMYHSIAENGVLAIKINDIAKTLKIGRNTTYKALKELETSGWLHRIREGKAGLNHYYLTTPRSKVHYITEWDRTHPGWTKDLGRGAYFRHPIMNHDFCHPYRQSAWMPAAVLYSDLSVGARVLMMALSAFVFQDTDGCIWPSIETLAAALNNTPRTVYRNLVKLEEQKLIKKHISELYPSNIYQIVGPLPDRKPQINQGGPSRVAPRVVAPWYRRMTPRQKSDVPLLSPNINYSIQVRAKALTGQAGACPEIGESMERPKIVEALDQIIARLEAGEVQPAIGALKKLRGSLVTPATSVSGFYLGPENELTMLRTMDEKINYTIRVWRREVGVLRGLDYDPRRITAAQRAHFKGVVEFLERELEAAGTAKPLPDAVEAYMRALFRGADKDKFQGRAQLTNPHKVDCPYAQGLWAHFLTRFKKESEMSWFETTAPQTREIVDILEWVRSLPEDTAEQRARKNDLLRQHRFSGQTQAQDKPRREFGNVLS